jgi:hypothetical protein
MDLDIIQGMINDSVWKNPDNEIIYQFANGKDLSINGKEPLSYKITFKDNKIQLLIGLEKSYNIEYINDFILKLCNTTESFRIMPE